MLEKDMIFLEEYRVLGNLGKGGMGSVYLAENMKEHKKYAIKEQQITKNNLSFILSEIDIQKKLNHSALPAIQRVHRTETHIYIIMDYINGRTLSSLLEKSGVFEEKRVVRWAIQICDILKYLHNLEQPIVYRDLKPSNIMIDNEDNIHLIDFGIAQEYENPRQSGKKVVALTRGYAAPEQYDSKYHSDVRTDIYALGVTVHYLLTGKNPVEPPYHFERVKKLKSDVSYAMEEIVRKCLQLNPDRRYRTAEILYQELTHLEDLEKKLAQKRRRRRIIIVLVTAIMLGILFSTYLTIGNKRGSQISQYFDKLAQAEQRIADKDFEQAYTLIEEMIEFQPEAEEGYLAMVKWLKEQQKYEECFQYISQNILSRFPDIYDNEEFLELLGNLYMEIDQPEQAEYYWQELEKRRDK